MTDENVVLDVPSTEEKAQHYSAMGDSVTLIHDVIAGNAMANETDEEKKDCVTRNVEHLKIMVAKEWWGDEDMQPSNEAVNAGEAYTA
jgi:hypothetical protein